MRIALATCADLPEWEKDDRPLHEAFDRRGLDARPVVWNDASVDWSRFDACLIRTTWDYTSRLDDFLAWATRVDGATLLLNPLAIVRWNAHKRYLRDLERRGVSIIPTVWLDRGSTVDVAQIALRQGWSSAMLKPAIGATARETLRFAATRDELAAAQRHVDRLLAREDLLLQPYLDAVEHEGELSVIYIDRRPTHAVRKIPVGGDYRTQDDFGASDHPVTLDPSQRALADRIIAAVEGDLVYARVDLLRDQRGDLLLTELELLEPSLFFRHAPLAADALADAVVERIEAGERTL